MRKFIIHIIFLLISLAIILRILTEVTDRGLQKTEIGNFKEWNDIFSKRIKPDIIIQGSSRAWVQYNTFIIDSSLHANSYNMGMDGSPFDVQYLRYIACINNGIVPKTIIQNVDWETISTNTPTYQPYQFLPYLKHEWFRKQISDSKLLPTTLLSTDILKYSGEFKAIQIGVLEYLGLNHYLSTKHKGFYPGQGDWNYQNLKSRLEQTRINNARNLNVEKLFENFLRDCRKRHINVILVYSPPYYKLKKVIDTQSTIHYFKDISIKYHIKFINLDNHPVSLDSTNFCNSTHYNAKGASLFTLELVKHIQQL